MPKIALHVHSMRPIRTPLDAFGRSVICHVSFTLHNKETSIYDEFCRHINTLTVPERRQRVQTTERITLRLHGTCFVTWENVTLHKTSYEKTSVERYM